MPTSANHAIPTPSPSDLADIPEDLKAMADKIDSELDAIAPSQITGVGAGKLLIANASGVVTPQTITGDATISNTGALKIGQGKITALELENDAVNSSKILTGSVTRTHVPKTFIQSKRTIFINQAANSYAEHTITWDVPFANTSYTPVAHLLNSNPAPGLQIIRFTSKLTGSIKILVANYSSSADSATIGAIGIAD